MKVFRAARTALLLLVTLVIVAGCGTAQETPSGSGSGSGTPGTPNTAGKVGTIVKTEKGQYSDISAAELNTMLADKDVFLVDVHVPNEGRLPDLDARIPYDKIAEQLDSLPSDKSAEIVLTCRSGSMSTMASKTLADLGYTNLYNLVGGFNAWKDAGYPFTPEP